MSRDGHRDWLIVFDGLDELAKEGASSETAAQEFASSLADWRGRLGDTCVRFLVLGRAPSMQEARRRLGLHGQGTIHVLGMAPLKKIRHPSDENISFRDPHKLRDQDQREEYWRRWAVAKGLSIELPEAMKVDELADLTNEPLLAYLLILSGYVSEQWTEAAENRNRIYRAIFNQIWERESDKPTRMNLNDLGKEGFESLLQALGIAAWRGGGRTGDENTFVLIRDIFMRPDLLAVARVGATADLGNVALLFYTRKDEEGGQGYEFLHKSFGEYLTAKGLFNAFIRWGTQVNNPTSDFSSTEFLRRWLRLTGPAPVTREIVSFLRNEARLRSAEIDSVAPWNAARQLATIAERMMDIAVREGLPAHELGLQWRSAESQERNSEEALLAILDALARAGYPDQLLHSSEPGGWKAGPIKVEEFVRGGFAKFIKRMTHPTDGWVASTNFFVPMLNTPVSSLISRLSLTHTTLFGLSFGHSDLTGVDFENSNLTGCNFVHCNLAGSNFSKSNLDFSRFFDVNLVGSNFADADLSEAEIDARSLTNSGLPASLKKRLLRVSKSRARARDEDLPRIESVKLLDHT